MKTVGNRCNSRNAICDLYLLMNNFEGYSIALTTYQLGQINDEGKIINPINVIITLAANQRVELKFEDIFKMQSQFYK
jgi:hypothetical protein